VSGVNITAVRLVTENLIALTASTAIGSREGSNYLSIDLFYEAKLAFLF